MKKKILIVEYDSPTIDLLKEILSYKVFDITIAGEGDIAKKLIKKKKYDLIISAAMLPKFHGFELSKYSKKVQPDTLVIIISGVYKGPDYRTQALSEFNADEFIEKPIDRNKFIETVLSFLGLTRSDLINEQDPGSTQIPAFDTKKIKAQVSDDGQQKPKLSSEDIFGDLIEDVENLPEHKIELDQEATLPGSDPGIKAEIKSEEKLSVGDNGVNLDFNDLLKDEPVKKDKKVEKKIEDDIMKKFEETLSGLGLKDTEPGIKKKVKPEKKSIKDQTAIEIKTVDIEKKPEKVKKPDAMDDYEIQGLIARGGMAEIFKAKKVGAQGFEKTIAFKKILSGYGADDKYIEMFVDEAKIAAELSHPNIVQIYDFGKKDNFYFIAMEYVEGKDLRLILRKLSDSGQILDEYLSIYICLKILEALSYAHSAKDKYGNSLDIVHRDVSPPNILVSYSGEIKLTDFGVSKASNKLHQTLSGALKGKLLYMSPEQAKADKDIDRRSDIYSVGVILFELLTGKKLFKGNSEMEVLKMVQDGKITKPSEFEPEIDPELENIILKALNKNRNARYSEASEMSKELESYLYKNFNHIPTPIHVNTKIFELFKSEIHKDGIRISQKQVPFEIIRIRETEKTELIDIPRKNEPGETELLDEHEPVETQEKESPGVEEGQAGITVTLPPEDYPDQKKEKEVISEDSPADSETDAREEMTPSEEFNEADQDRIAVQQQPEIKSNEQVIPESLTIEKFKNEKKTRPLFLILFIVVAVSAGIYFLMNMGSKSTQDANPERKIITPKIDKASKKNAENLSEQLPAGNKMNTNDLNQQSEIPSKNSESSSDLANIIKDSGTDTEGKSKKNDKKALEEKNTADEKEKIKKDNELKKKREEDKRRRAALEKKKKEAEAEKKRIEEEARKKKEEEDRLNKIEEDKKKQEEEARQKKLEEDKKKKLLEEQNRVKPGQIVPLSEVDTKPVAISSPAPVLSRNMRIGRKITILVSMLIDENGNISKLRLIRKTPKSNINNAILRAIQKWKFQPAIKKGVRVKVWKTIPLTIK